MNPTNHFITSAIIFGLILSTAHGTTPIATSTVPTTPRGTTVHVTETTTPQPTTPPVDPCGGCGSHQCCLKFIRNVAPKCQPLGRTGHLCFIDIQPGLHVYNGLSCPCATSLTCRRFLHQPFGVCL